MEKEFEIGDKIITTGNRNSCRVPIGTIGKITKFSMSRAVIIDSYQGIAPWISRRDYKHHIEELPVFKIIKQRANKITMVQNNEGNIFGIGDKISLLPNLIEKSQMVKNRTMKITGFRYRKDKGNLCAITDLLPEYVIGIEKIQHVLEFEKEFVLPKNWYIVVTKENQIKVSQWKTFSDNSLAPINNIVGMVDTNRGLEKGHNPYGKTIDRNSDKYWYDFGTEITFEQFKKYVLKEEPVKEETLLEKAQRLYPIGTRFIANNTNTECIVTTGIYKEMTIYGNSINEYSENGDLLSTKNVFHNILDCNGNWAKILNPKLKVGDTFIKEGYTYPLTIINIEIINDQEVAFFKTYNNISGPFYRILTKNIKEWTSV